MSLKFNKDAAGKQFIMRLSCSSSCVVTQNQDTWFFNRRKFINYCSSIHPNVPLHPSLPSLMLVKIACVHKCCDICKGVLSIDKYCLLGQCGQCGQYCEMGQ